VEKQEAQAVAEGLSPEAWEVIDLVAASLGIGVTAFIQDINKDANQDVSQDASTEAAPRSQGKPARYVLLAEESPLGEKEALDPLFRC